MNYGEGQSFGGSTSTLLIHLQNYLHTFDQVFLDCFCVDFAYIELRKYVFCAEIGLQNDSYSV